MSEQTGLIMDIDHFAVHDGPGIRTCIYVKGCPLSCAWCHSPESQSPRPQILFAESRCTLCGACASVCPHQRIEHGNRIFCRDAYAACGGCVAVCPSHALSLSGRRMTVDEVVAEAAADKVFFQNSGGVTFTGGEVLLQAEFIRSVLVRLREHGIHVIAETGGYGARDALLSLAEYVDVFYFDYKLGNPAAFAEYTGGDSEVVQSNLAALREQTRNIVLRIPLIPGYTDTSENVGQGFRLARDLNLDTVHLLPYNASAVAKYGWIGKEYALPDLAPRAGLIEELLALAPAGIHVEVL